MANKFNLEERKAIERVVTSKLKSVKVKKTKKKKSFAGKPFRSKRIFKKGGTRPTIVLKSSQPEMEQLSPFFKFANGG